MVDLFNLKAPKTRPILFKDAMVRATLDGTKTQTRRVIKPQPPEWCGPGDIAGPELFTPSRILDGGEIVPGKPMVGVYDLEGEWGTRCPYGAPGDRLYVREVHAWADQMVLGYELEDPNAVAYRADKTALLFDFPPPRPVDTYAWNWDMLKWRPSIHMPKWASRITLEVTDVRCERVQEITEDGVDAEGVFNPSGLHLAHCGLTFVHPDQTCVCGDRSPEEEFALLWDSINAKRGFSWESNPWVWVVEFKRVEAPNG